MTYLRCCKWWWCSSSTCLTQRAPYATNPSNQLAIPNLYVRKDLRREHLSSAKTRTRTREIRMTSFSIVGLGCIPGTQT